MKKITLLFLFFAGCAGFAHAQAYSFSVSTENYQPLTNAISLNNGAVWDDPAYTIPIGFPFPIGDGTINTLYIPDYLMGAGLSTAAQDQGIRTELYAMVADLKDRGTASSQSPISYKLTGGAGNHILKIQWQNAGFWDGTGSDYINFQVWLYQQSGTIEFHYGPREIQDPNAVFQGAGPFVAVFIAYNPNTGVRNGPVMFLDGDPANPGFTEIDPDETPSGGAPQLDGVPANGTVYTFINTDMGVPGFQKPSASITPNPAHSFLDIHTEHKRFKVGIFTLRGRKLPLEIPANQDRVDVSGLSEGLYFIRISTENGSVVKKFIKK